MGDVTKIYPDGAGKNPDNVLELAIGSYEKVVIVGYDKEGVLDFRASLNLADVEVLWLLEEAKNYLMTGTVVVREDD